MGGLLAGLYDVGATSAAAVTGLDDGALTELLDEALLVAAHHLWPGGRRPAHPRGARRCAHADLTRCEPVNAGHHRGTQ